jgi:hypothetical protein
MFVSWQSEDAHCQHLRRIPCVHSCRLATVRLPPSIRAELALFVVDGYKVLHDGCNCGKCGAHRLSLSDFDFVPRCGR